MKTTPKKQLRPERVLALGFLCLIGVGTLLLSLPIATQNGQSIGLFDSLFTATSAVCVTGLVAVDTGTTFSLFGQAVLLGLIQVGGLGFMVFATAGMLLLGRRISLSRRMVMRESMNVGTLSGLARLTMVYGAMAFTIELFGALLLTIRFVPLLGWGKGLWYSFFHAISAFCNAGFDLFGGFSSLTGFHDDPLILLTISLMIILGGLGFAVMLDLIQHRGAWNRLSLQSKIVLPMTGGLLLLGTLVYACVEWNNPSTLGADSWPIKLLGAFFQSVTMRTAGFNSVDLGALTDGSKLFSSVLMFIGASPASTGGGVKTTTIALVLFTVWNEVRGREDVVVMKKRIDSRLCRRALALVVISLAVLLITTQVLAMAEKGQVPLIDLLFEMASAVATVGVSAAGTPTLSLLSRALIIPVMFFGRVGPLTLAMALARRSGGKSTLKYPQGDVMVG